MTYSGKILFSLLAALMVFRVVSPAETGKDNFESLVRTDRSLVVPGKGGEGVLLGEEFAAAAGRLSGNTFAVSRFRNDLELYRDVLKVNSPHRILFDRIIYFPGRETVLLSFRGRVSSIIGLSSRRITSDSINLEKGLEYILFSYGNEHLVSLKNKNGAIYIYLDNGIAFVDDNSDNSLDMYILFKTGRDK